MRLPGRELEWLLGEAIPADHARQTLAEAYIEARTARPAGRPWRVLDLGCGPGGSVDFFRAADPEVEWTGLDVPDSPTPPARDDARFVTFDGRVIPFEDGSFDLVFCKQVLEHVRHPGPLLREARRVLTAEGCLAGSTSQLEPFHAYSFWGYTPLGFRELLEEAALELLEIRPGIDALALIGYRLVPRTPPFERLWGRWWGGRSPLNRLIDAYGRVRRLDARSLNATKLLFCGQFAFLAAPGAAAGERATPAPS